MEITFNKKISGFILKAIAGIFVNSDCKFCGKFVDKNNLGAVVKDGLICDNLFCLIQYVERTKDESKHA